MRRMEGQCVELMISHDCASGSIFAHGPANTQDVFNARSAVDEITAEDHLPRWMTEDAGMFCVSESVQELSQFVSVAVDIADDVVHGKGGGGRIFDFLLKILD